MMKAKVLVAFTDKYTGQTYKPGDIVDVTAARFNEITKAGRLVEAYDESTAPKETKEGNK